MVEAKKKSRPREFVSGDKMVSEIVVDVFPWLSRALGNESRIMLTERVSPRGESLRCILERMALKHPGFGATIYDAKRGTVHETAVIFVNNQPVPKDLRVRVRSGDRITVTPLYSGG